MKLFVNTIQKNSQNKTKKQSDVPYVGYVELRAHMDVFRDELPKRNKLSLFET